MYTFKNIQTPTHEICYIAKSKFCTSEDVTLKTSQTEDSFAEYHKAVLYPA